ncbi:OmpH family outer membrane protein [Taibaiella koreensis]|uniref:OmpH family outer membrane protein n=1 Tax=Taibaiella koreensis TaxID=1268548 RepID=UPI000E59C302|nr:OmpH family outer membrane protein [Taibaiella koreensis]
MKKILFLLALGMTIGFGASAQKKTGYINSRELLETMPEARKADSVLTKYGKELETTMKSMAADAQTKFKAYQDGASTMSDAVKEVKEKELNDLQNRIEEFRQGADDKMSKKREELFKPILDKAQKAIKDVGTEGGFDYIFDGTQLLYAKETENIMPQVKAKLGIK